MVRDDDTSESFADIEPPDWGVVGRFLAGEASAADAALVRAWVASDERHGVLLEGMRRAWEGAGRPAGEGFEGETIAGAVWARIHGTARSQPLVESEAPGVSGASGARSRWASGRTRTVARLAAAVVLAVGGWAVVSHLGWRTPGSPVFREFASARGERTAITLVDGTRVLLGPETRLRVPVTYGQSERMVELEGEALLTVVHDQGRPFAVRTGRATVRDIGTTFIVRAYGDEAAERVAVSEGSVAIGEGDAVQLRARDRAVVDVAGRVAVARGVDLAQDWAWVQGDLAFVDTPLRDVVRDVGRLYDLDVTIADSALGAKPITGTFQREAVDEVLREITFAAGARYERAGRRVVIRLGVAPVGDSGLAPGGVPRFARARATG